MKGKNIFIDGKVSVGNAKGNNKTTKNQTIDENQI